MANKAELKGRVSLNTKSFQSKIRRMKRTGRKWGAAITKAARVAAKGVAVVTAAVAAASAVMFKLTKATADAGDKMQKMALRTGLSVDALERLDYISKITGSSVENIQKGMKQMARSIAYAKDGLTTYTREFDKMGLSMEDFEGVSPEQAFDKISKAVSGMKDPIQQAATAATLFGRSGQMMLPMLKSGESGMAKLRKRFEEIGFAFRQEGADAAAKFNDKLTDLKTAVAGVRNKLVLAFIANFSGGIETLIQKVVEFRKQGKFAEWAATAAGAVNNFIEKARMLFAQLQSVVVPIFKILLREGRLVWNGLKLAGMLAWRGLQSVINSAIARVRKSMVGLQTAGEVAWNILKESAKLAFAWVQKRGIMAFQAVMIAAELAVNKIIKAYNKIPGLKKVELVEFESIDKADGKVKELDKQIQASKDAMKIGGDAWKPIEEGAEKVRKIEEERKEIEEEFNRQMAKRVGTVDKVVAQIDKDKKALAEGKDIQDAQNKLLEKQNKIGKTHEGIRKKIAGWQMAALDAERKRGEAAKEGEGALKEQEAALKRMSKNTDASMLRAAFAGITRVARGEPRPAMAKGKREDKEQKKIEMKQLKIQEQIALNTGKKPELATW